MLIIDAHLDLAMNAMEWNRDLRRSVYAIREGEKGLDDKPDRAKGVVALPQLRAGNIGLVVATQIARYAGAGHPLPGWNSAEQAWAQTQAQLAWYKTMEESGEMVAIRNKTELQDHQRLWNNNEPNDKKPVGYILSLEGADSLITVDHLERSWSDGLRAVGPAHYGPGRYANGTDATGRMDKNGLALLKKMEGLNMILDVTHLCDDAFWQALDHFNGPVWASHNNCRALVKHNRQFSDEMIKVLIQKGAVIGAAFDAWMIVPDWQRGVSTPTSLDCNLEKIIDHIDHICQLAGNARHVGIGSDLDGAFGKEQCPHDLETIEDIPKLISLLEGRGYAPDDIKLIMHGNWFRFLEEAWT
jgi:membrane dipeptidase